MNKSYKDIAFKLILSISSILFMLLVLELGARIYKNEWHWRNFWLMDRDFVSSAYPVQFDDELGWVPEAGVSGSNNIWGSLVTIEDDTTRSNGDVLQHNSLPKLGAVLAVGDSFVFGDEVSDSETWPAYLEDMIGVRVINGGVCGYGIDQSLIRLKKLAKKYKPRIVLFGFTPDDVRRCGLSVYIRVPKPYFTITEGNLSLHDQHISEDAISANDGVVRRWLGYSLFIHKVMRRTFPQYWLQGSWCSVSSGEDGRQISGMLLHELCTIYDELPELEKIYVVVQYLANPSKADYATVDYVLESIDNEKVEIIDLREVLNRIRLTDFNKFQSLYYKHMTAEGNKVVAKVIADIFNRKDKENE